MLVPGCQEWDMSGLPASRRSYLQNPVSFEQIVELLLQNAVVLAVRTEPYRDRRKSVPKETYQAIFQVRTDPIAYDLMYNAPDGLRGRYWQSPERGYLATRLLIDSLKGKLLAFAETHPPKRPNSDDKATREEVVVSLDASSAKVWIRESDDSGRPILNEECSHIAVSRWEKNELNSEINKGMWRRAPVDDQLEIKGALIRPDGTEEIPDGKRGRSCAIHHFGFT